MRNFDVDISIDMNDKKISAIKAWRDVSGLGLSEAKNFVEEYGYGRRMTVRMTELQLGRFVSYSYAGCTGGYGIQPHFIVHSAKAVDSVAHNISGNPINS